MAPRWFYPVIAACVVVTTLALVAYVVVQRDTGRWIPVDVGGSVRIVDSRTGDACQGSVNNPRYRWCLPSPAGAPIRGDSIVADQP